MGKITRLSGIPRLEPSAGFTELGGFVELEGLVELKRLTYQKNWQKYDDYIDKNYATV